MFYLLQAATGPAFDWQAIFFGEEDGWFLVEILIRTLIMYVVILTALRLIGKRGVRQLSVFELVVIIGLGSAAGDPMFYKEVGLVNCVIVFVVIIAAYRLTTFLTTKSKKFEELIEGKTVCLIENGVFSYQSFSKEDLAQDEFFSELRIKGTSQLGQIDRAYLETSGELSVFFYADKEVKPGLPILLHEFSEQHTRVPEDGLYACSFCGVTKEIKKSGSPSCPVCKQKKWVKASLRKRVV